MVHRAAGSRSDPFTKKSVHFQIAGVLLVTFVHASTADGRESGIAEAEEQLTLESLEDGSERSDLPILPPLILLDFTNGTNSTDEKTKRTINDNLGYGFQSNNFFAGKKFNYYFPSGKSATTVSIEESITPFLPRTIIERTKPVTEKPEANTKVPEKTAFRSQHYVPTFGQKTKLHVTSGDAFDFSRYTSTVKPAVTTQKSFYSASTTPPTYRGFYTARTSFKANPSHSESYSTQNTLYGQSAAASDVSTTLSPFEGFSTPKSVGSTINPVVSEQFYHPVKTLPPGSPSSYNKNVQSSFGDYPKYTYENGVKYEHKIVWKYPDGRVSDNPPSSYVHSYSEYDATPQTVYPDSKVKDIDYTYQPNLRYQGPMQFPKDSEPSYPPQTPFVKPPPQNNAGPKYYQQYENTAFKYSVPKLPVGSPNAEYLPPADGNSKSQGFSEENQKTLHKMLSPPKQNYDNDNNSPNYANLLNYNPSISQYIKNPASILNAQPTFIQAGNSLIPVIILRVDGAPPVQQKPLSNINLKALIQQYITQYASSVSDLSQDSNYDFSDEAESQDHDPHYDLKKLTETLRQISRQTMSPKHSESVTDSYGNILGPEYKALAESRRHLNYRTPYKKPQKVKNVQIVEDPRYPKQKK